MTSDAMPGTGPLSEKSGFDGYLPKPIEKADLTRILRAVLAVRSEGETSFVTRHSIAEASLKGADILLVDDNPVNFNLTFAMLESFGCKVHGAKDGLEAVEMIKKGAFKAVLMDLQMPQMGGMEATFIVRRDINKTVPIIGLSAAALKEDEEKYDCYFDYSNTQCQRYVLALSKRCEVCTVIKINRRWQRIAEKNAGI